MTIHQIINRIKEGPNDITLYEGASQTLIEEFENKLNFRLPPDLRVLYEFCNGFESEEDLFRIVPLNEILSRREYNQTELKSNQFHIAEYLVYCDMWTIEIDALLPNMYTILGSTGDAPLTLTYSFAEFIKHFLDGGVFNTNGLYQWEESIRKGSN